MNLLEIGRIGKAHGLRGDVLVSITSDRPERTAPGAVWFLDAGPVTVESIQPYQQRWLVRLTGVTSREAAESIGGQTVRAEPIDDPDALWVHELVGATVVTPDGRTWGTVVSVLANPADDLLELADGTLVPVGFVVDSSGLPDLVVVDPPPGLLGEEP
ncbi:MAG: 16S rRNA processing protein RimM [Acidimicrobiales bacterium]|nr:16S rRNA processing protein RimM [Acidimicrobiales bacterium]